MKYITAISTLLVTGTPALAHESASSGLYHLLEHGPLLQGTSLAVSLASLMALVVGVVALWCRQRSCDTGKSDTGKR